MKALVVIEVDFPNGGSLREVQDTFNDVAKVAYKRNSYLVSLDEDIQAINQVILNRHK